MDLEYELATLDSKLSDLGDQCGKVNNISNDYNGSSLKKLSGTEIASLSSKLTASIERLQKAYTNCNNWFSGFDSELKSCCISGICLRTPVYVVLSPYMSTSTSVI